MKGAARILARAQNIVMEYSPGEEPMSCHLGHHVAKPCVYESTILPHGMVDDPAPWTFGRGQ